MENINIKTGDVFSFSYKPEYVCTHHEPYHCFDGQLIASVDDDGNVTLTDTYWMGGQSSSEKQFTLEEALKVGSLTFRFNVNDVVICNESDKAYYKYTDIFNFSYQHGCYKRFVRKKDAKRDKEVILNSLRYKIQELESELQYTKRDLANMNDLLKDVEGGKDLDSVYIPFV
jgi:hypothetical protein